MTPEQPTTKTVDRGARVALIFALVAERLTVFYEHDHWLTQSQGASLVADWLSRSQRSLPLAERTLLSALSDELARQTATTVSPEAGRYIAHELTEALDTRYQSELGETIMTECERLLDRGLAG